MLKHRKRKEKAVRKLEGTRANLERLQDLIGELQRQLKPLGRQAEAARKAAVIQAEQRDAKARLLADDLSQAQQALAEDLADEAAAQAARERAEAEVNTALAAEEGAETRLREANASFDRCQEQWYALAALQERIASTMSVSAERMQYGDAEPAIASSSRDPDALEAEAAQVREQEAGFASERATAASRLAEATERRGQAEVAHAAAEQAYAAALRAVADRREGLARLKGQVASAQSRLDAGQDERRRLERSRDEAIARAQVALDQYRHAEVSLAGLGADESNLDAAWEAASAEVREREANLAGLAGEETRLAQERATLTARAEALRLATEQRDGSADLLACPGVLGRLGDLIHVTPGWEQAIAAALGAAGEAVVTESLGVAIKAIEHLHIQDLGRALMVVASPQPAKRVPLTDLVSAPAELAAALSGLLAGYVAVEDLSAAQAAVATDPGVVAVTRAGERVASWLVEGGSVAKPSLLALNAELAETEERLGQVVAEADRRRFTRQTAQAELDQAKAREAAALAALHDSDAQLSAMAETLGALKQAQAAAEREAERLSQAITAAGEARESYVAQHAEFARRLAVASAEEFIEPDPAERDGHAVTARLARQQEMEARLALRTVEEQARSIAGRADGLLRAAAAERQARAKAQARAEQLRREAAVAEAVHGAAQRLTKLAVATRERAAVQRSRAEEERRAAEAATGAARQASRTAATQLDELVRGAHRDELVRIEHRMRIEQLAERSLSELGLEAEQLVAEYGPDQLVPVITSTDGAALGPDDEVPDPVPYVREEQTKRLRRAERGLLALGRVNPLALEEFEALKARHAFLAEQLADLKQTRADLLALIDDVDRRVQEIFEAAYQDVQATFGTVFERLFPGGEGRLLLTDPGNWLETGVDVEARPAGKQVKRLSLLSGGERSLVAVAFLVSLFIARPSPFYILDEVEAALDDANLGRLLGIYEELRENSQLLVITHQKRTMEIADSLYGVTMRGDGISTVVSQRLQQGRD